MRTTLRIFSSVDAQHRTQRESIVHSYKDGLMDWNCLVVDCSNTTIRLSSFGWFYATMKKKERKNEIKK